MRAKLKNLLAGRTFRRVAVVVGGVMMAALFSGCVPNLPVFSPDGKFVAVCLTPDGEFEATRGTPPDAVVMRDLYIAAVDNSAVWRVTDFSAADHPVMVGQPAFSGDGNALAFVGRTLDGNDITKPVETVYAIHNLRANLADLGNNPTLSLSVANHGAFVATVRGARVIFPRFSPSGTRLAWIETTQKPNWTSDYKDPHHVINSGLWGRLRVMEIFSERVENPQTGLAEMRAAWRDVPLPAGFDAAIPEVAWVDDDTLLVARRKGPAKPSTSEAEIVRVPLGEPAGTVSTKWSGWLSSFHVGLSVHSSGAIFFDQAEVNWNGKANKIVMLPPDGGEPKIIADEGWHVWPRIDHSSGSPVLRWFSETAGASADKWNLRAHAVAIGESGALGEPQPVRSIEVHFAGQNRSFAGPLWTGMPAGGSGYLIAIPRPGDLPGVEKPRHFDDRPYTGQHVMLATPAENGPSGMVWRDLIGGMVRNIQETCPNKFALLDAARRTMNVPATIGSSAMLFSVTVIRRDDEGKETERKTGDYREFISGENVRTEEFYGDGLIRTWNGQMAGSQSGSGDFTLKDPRERMNLPARETARELREKIRMRKLFLLDGIDVPVTDELPRRTGPTEPITFEFSTFAHREVLLEGRSRPTRLVYLFRYSVRQPLKFIEGEQLPVTHEQVFIGFEIVRDRAGRIKVWPREVRTRNVWLDAGGNARNAEGNPPGETTVKQSVFRFVGDFKPVRGINLPGEIRAYETPAISPFEPVDTRDENLLFMARMLERIDDYKFTSQPPFHGKMFTIVGVPLPPACFRSLHW